MGKCKNSYAARMTADRRLYEYLMRRYTRQQMLDFVTVALHRMGWGEKRLNEFEQKVSEVYLEYADLMTADQKDDRELVYSKECLDRELRECVGDRFVPYKQRYDLSDEELKILYGKV